MSAEQVPSGWSTATIETVCIDTEQVKPEHDKEFTYIDISSIDRFRKLITSPQRISGSDAPSRARKLVKEGDILVALTRPNLNAVAMIPADLDGEIASTGFEVLRPHGIEARWLYYFVRTAEFIEAMSQLVQGALYPAVRGKDVLSTPIPIAPINEQRRIADKLDRVLARVDAANEHLSRIAPLIKRFRQSVLSAATSGKLTSDLHRDNRNAYERLPLGDLASTRLGKMLDKKKNTGTLVKYIRNVNVRWFSFDLSDLLSIRIEPHEVQTLSIQDGDVLICEGGEPGRCAVWREGSTDLVFQKAIHRARLDSKLLLPEWLAFCLKHQSNTGEIEDFFTGTTIKHLTGVSLAKLLIPVPPIEEQCEIVRRVEKLFAFADRLEERLSQAQEAVQKLTPALLAKAFRGELVPQDPNDEPASELLKRLQESRANDTKTRRARKPRATSAVEPS